MDSFVFTLLAFLTGTKLRENIGMGWDERRLKVLFVRSKKINR